MADRYADRYMVHAKDVPNKFGGTSYHYYIRERGAPIREWVCRVYDATLADSVCAAMNQYDGMQRRPQRANNNN